MLLGLMVMAAFPQVVAAQALDEAADARRLEVRVETLANRMAGAAESCEVRQVKRASAAPTFVAWSTLGEAGPTETAPPGTAGMNLRRPVVRCGAEAFPGSPPAPAGAPLAPWLIQEVSVGVGWDGGAMDPGPVGAVKVALTLTARHLTGVAPDGKPLYSAPVTDRRTPRFEAGEELVVPVPVEAPGRETLGVPEVLLRIRVGWAGREGGTAYGALAVMDAAPGSEIMLDGGVAGHAGADGRLLLPNVPVGQREVHLRGESGGVVSRPVSVVLGRTMLVAPEAVGSGAPPPPTLTPAGKNAKGFQEYQRGRDGATMVLIPAGEFLMGNLATEGAPLPHTVYLSSFLMDKLPVTVGRFKRFAAATGRPLPPDPYWGVHDNAPVAFVRWDEARAYCEWTGGRLPTEAEREKATRGTDGRMFAWGDDPPGPEHAVFGRVWGQEGNDTVGMRPAGASPYGLLDMAGNVWEFCEDWWDQDYFQSSPPKDPLGPKTGRARVVRGASWDSRWVTMSASMRTFAYTGYREGDFGFRCAMELVKEAADAGQTGVKP
jgi:formylglycine-generating enzyme required for sulfatase activity